MSDTVVRKGERFFATPDEYLAFEEEADEKHEWWDGEVVAMAGASDDHNVISVNLSAVFYNRLKGTPCGARSSDARVRTPIFRKQQSQQGLYTYPDLTVVCGQPEFDPTLKGPETLINPTVLVEILSPSTERKDRGGKFQRYQTIESFREYVLVSQEEPQIQVFLRRDNGDWKITWFHGLDAVAKLESIDVDLPLVDIYDRIKFEEPGADEGE